MSDGGYKIRNQASIHFMTFAAVEWVDVFYKKRIQGYSAGKYRALPE